MKHKCIILLLIITFLSGQAQYSREEYIQKYQLLAIEEMVRSGIPASIKMAQAILESSNGNSQLSRNSNNHFGIKCKRGWQGQRVFHDDDEKDECFRKYNSVVDSYIDHTNFLVGNPRYASLFRLPPGDYVGWAKGLKAAGYATAGHYDRTLIKIIDDNKLYLLDNKQIVRPMMAYEERTRLNPGISSRVTINPFISREIFRVNDIKAVSARSGDTYEILAQSLGMEAWELYYYNDHGAGYRPQPNEVVYIEAKKRRPARNHEHHRVSEGETMHFISQIYGIRLKPLYRRNRLKIGEQPTLGDTVYLRNRKPAN